MTVAGGRIAYDDTGGDGPLVMLIPGLGDRRQTYRFLAPLLEQAGYRVVTTDLRGHGESSAPWNDYTQTAVGLDVITLLKHLDAGPAVLVGNSYAGGAVIWAAAHAPAQVIGIVPLDGFVRDVPLNLFARLAVRLMAASPLAWSMYYGYAHPTAGPADLGPYRTALVTTLREPGRRQAMAAMLLGATPEGERWAPSVDCPALVVIGTKDPDFPHPEEEAALQARMLTCEVQMIEGAGHYPHSEFPERTAEALLPFLKQAFAAWGKRVLTS
ncbi:alpha/beta fold hydrolase [Streptosporangium sp. CA-135522]|uniref:alpha/beta fold hydrolase n=1 Tax=Streptosporangium sp. CA-135522 TaxID=3240072 RepID=UPI003D9400D6